MVDSIKLPLSIVVSSVEETERLGFLFARMLKDTGNRAFVAMYGDLGVGKTSFVRGFCSYFGISRVKSPTFSIVNEHHSDKDSVFHFGKWVSLGTKRLSLSITSTTGWRPSVMEISPSRPISGRQ